MHRGCLVASNLDLEMVKHIVKSQANPYMVWVSFFTILGKYMIAKRTKNTRRSTPTFPGCFIWKGMMCASRLCFICVCGLFFVFSVLLFPEHFQSPLDISQVSNQFCNIARHLMTIVCKSPERVISGLVRILPIWAALPKPLYTKEQLYGHVCVIHLPYQCYTLAIGLSHLQHSILFS